jgi:eukaryotic-like serine/threonine-protein kinase
MTDIAGAALEAGTTVGSYRIDRLLGRGGMGAVYLAYDTTLHRQVALKVLTGSAESEVSRARLLREARSAAALNHPNICTIYEVGEADGLSFIAMEYVQGPSLRDRLDAGVLRADEAVPYSLQAADALAYAHEHGVVHRDLKAANVIVTNRGQLKIVDFGLARRQDTAMADVTRIDSVAPIGTLAGTPYAMAPEQLRGEMADARTDIWALGVLMYEMVSGTRPFAAATTAELFSAILRDPPAPLPDGVPKELRIVIARCLEKAPERRYQQASEVRASLEPLQTSPPARRSGSPYRSAQRPWLVVAAALIGTAAVLVGFRVAGLGGRLAAGLPANAPVTLAVLPLENQAGDPEQEYFSDGLTEEIAKALSRLQAQRLTVIARTSSMRYKHSAKRVDEIGRELDANTILKGSVARSGDRVRIVAELVQTSGARQLWRETYDRRASDLFALEHEMAGAVARALGVPVAVGEKKGLANTTNVNPEAYDLYLRGLSHVVRDNEEDIDQAIALLEQSAALDPTFVPVQAYLALAYGNKAAILRPNEPQWEEKGFAAARKALDLNADAPEAHYAQAMMLWRPSHGFPSREALSELRLALAAQPNFDEAWHLHAVILFHVGHLDAAVRDIERSLQINPGNTAARFRFGPIYVYQQKFEEAIAALDRVPREAYPAQWTYQRAWALISLGRLKEAGRLVDEALKNNPIDQGGVLHAARAMLRSKRGDGKGAEDDIREAIRVGKNFIHFHHTAYSIGAVYATLGEFDKAQEWIESAANDGFPNYAFFETDVNLEGLRAIPRFRAFLSRLRSEWEHIPGEPE